MEIELINWFHMCLGCLAIVCYEIIAINIEIELVPLKSNVFVCEKI